MKQIFYYFSLMTLVMVIGFSQAQAQPPAKMAPPLVHEKQVYVSESNNLFWPMEKNVWIRLATSPRDDAPSFLLGKIYKKSDEEEKDLLDKGIKMEIPGRQFVRWVNFLTKDETMFRFVADGAPPISKANFLEAPRFSTETTTYYGKGLTTEVLSNDDLSGVRQTYTSVDGLEFIPYQTVLAFNKEKEYNLRFYAVDNVGYAAEPVSINFIVDLTPPTSSHTVKTNFIENTLSTQSVIWLASQDELAGVQNIFFKFENQKDYTLYNPKVGVKVSGLDDGTHTLSYYAVDQVSNVEIVKQYTFYLDRIPSVVAHTFIGDLYKKDGKEYVSPRTRIQLTAEDNQIGPRLIEYKLDSGDFNKYVKPFTAPIRTGEFIVEYQAYDRLNNLTPSTTIKLLMDLVPTKTSHKIDGPNHSQGGGVLWITDQTAISLFSEDDLSGVQKVEYQIASDPVQQYNAKIRVANEGQYLFRYWGTDQVNNREMFSPILLIVDKTPPRIIEVFSIEPVREVKDDKAGMIRIYPVFTTLFLSALDNSAGLKQVRYSLNGAPMKEYKETMFFSEPGRYTVTTEATDNVGNLSSQTTVFLIEER
ncbi:MAG: PKD domain-containing protein [SAR324 cluster bacterium]|nr:PKD domain-containing protein [SAR324 cluster bacterium]